MSLATSLTINTKNVQSTHPPVGQQPNQSANPITQAIAKALGISTQQLGSDLQAGQSLQDIASAQGKSMSDVGKAIQSALDSARQQGQITQDQENSIMSFVNGSSFGSPQSVKQLAGMLRHGGHHHHGGGDADGGASKSQQSSSSAAAVFTPSPTLQTLLSSPSGSSDTN